MGRPVTASRNGGALRGVGAPPWYEWPAAAMADAPSPWADGAAPTTVPCATARSWLACAADGSGCGSAHGRLPWRRGVPCPSLPCPARCALHLVSTLLLDTVWCAQLHTRTAHTAPRPAQHHHDLTAGLAVSLSRCHRPAAVLHLHRARHARLCARALHSRRLGSRRLAAVCVPSVCARTAQRLQLPVTHHSLARSLTRLPVPAR